jgi:putative redox protein
MAKVTIRKSDVEGFYTGEAGEFKISIERTGNKVPRSIDLVLLGLGTCTISTVASFMERKEWPTDDLAVELSAEFDEKAGHYKDFSVKLHVGERISPEMRKVLLNVAKSCRVHNTKDARPHVEVEITQ